MWCNDLESNAAEPREISCHVSPGGGGGEYQFRCANIRTVMIDVVETDRGRLFRGALSLYPACIYSNIKIRVQRPPVRGWYGSMRLSNGRDPPLLAFLGRRCSSRWTDPALSDPANISPARRYATVLVVAPTRLSFARKPLRAELVSRSTCARSGIPERRANKISTCEIARFFLFHVESDSNGESVDRRCATRFLSFCKFSLRKISSSSKLGMDVLYLYFG